MVEVNIKSPSISKDFSDAKTKKKKRKKNKKKAKPVNTLDHSTKVCRFNLKGTCNRGDKCRFLHQLPEEHQQQCRVLSTSDTKEEVDAKVSEQPVTETQTVDPPVDVEEQPATETQDKMGKKRRGKKTKGDNKIKKSSSSPKKAAPAAIKEDQPKVEVTKTDEVEVVENSSAPKEKETVDDSGKEENNGKKSPPDGPSSAAKAAPTAVKEDQPKVEVLESKTDEVVDLPVDVEEQPATETQEKMGKKRRGKKTKGVNKKNKSSSSVTKAAPAAVKEDQPKVEVSESKTDEVEVVESISAPKETVEDPKEEEMKGGKSPSNGGGILGGVYNMVGSAASYLSPQKGAPLPGGLEKSLSLFTPEQQSLAKKLCDLPSSQSQAHLFEKWSDDAEFNDRKKAMVAKLELVDQSYPDGGLVGYIQNAVDLLEKSRQGDNPLEGWSPSVPQGEAFKIGTMEFLETEQVGLKEIGRCGFVLVAGGLGERLGYGDIKIGLPTELATGTTYIQFYIETILAFQSRYGEGKKLPLCIMTSGDTNDKTVALLKKKNYFGMDEDQITIVLQGKGVPALFDNDAHIALAGDDPYDILMKPHGHGDIHALLHSHNVAKSWLQKGIKWTVFFQDTNGLAFHTLALALGVSSKRDLIMNSITCPRKAKQAIGAVTKLTKGDQERTINVEYNQLDPLLRAATGDGDVNDESGFSPYPGNINQLLFQLEPYAAALERTSGIMPEFVNPKYVDEAKTVFKKPSRLECMMQDFPTVLEGADVLKVGFTSLASELCFSPVKNATADGVKLQQKGTQPGVAASGEADQSNAVCEILRSIGCNIALGSNVTFSGITVTSGPDCVLKPSFAACATEFKSKFPNPSAVKISGRSSLVLSGGGLVVESLDLDGALVVECEEGAFGTISGLIVENKGWVKVADEGSSSEVIRMRGYSMNKLETEKCVFKQDGTVEGNYGGVTDLSKPAAGESVERDTLCGNGCAVM